MMAWLIEGISLVTDFKFFASVLKMRKLVFTFTCLLFSQSGFAGMDKSIYLKHPIKQLKYWGDFKSKEMIEKIQKASPEILDYLIKDNINQGWPNRPVAPEISDDFLKDLRSAISEIPSALQNKMNQKLTGIVLVSDLGGSAYNDYVFDDKDHQIAGFIVLDISALNKKANEWATWKENSPFKGNSDFKIVAEIENDKTNNRKNALLYILLHELGHVFSIGRPEIAPWGVAEKDLGSLKSFEFSALSWQIQEDKFATHFDGKALNRVGLRYYASDQQKLSISVAPSLYSQLHGTNLPTLYSATNPFDDFAESFASYIHSVVMKKPWTIRIISKGKKTIEFRLCWDEARCAAKRRLLDKMLEN